MHQVWEIFKELTNPESIIRYGGLALLIFVIFAETGLMIGFFLPGDSLVFISGMICSTEPQLMNIHLLILISALTVAAVAGNVTGYLFGKKVGITLFNKDENLIFKKKYLVVTNLFYQKHGGKSLVLGRFLPIIRTFAPILAGIVKMEFKIFLFYTLLGGAIWIGSLTTLGYYLGRFAWVKENLEWIILGLVIATSLPILPVYMKNKNDEQRF